MMPHLGSDPREVDKNPQKKLVKIGVFSIMETVSPRLPLNTPRRPLERLSLRST